MFFRGSISARGPPVASLAIALLLNIDLSKESPHLLCATPAVDARSNRQPQGGTTLSLSITLSLCVCINDLM
jgi:hypothetical protein